MATLYITELNHIGGHQQAEGRSQPEAQAATWPPIAEQTVAISGGSIQSAVFNFQTTMLRLNADAVFSFAIGTNPIATTVTARSPANIVEYVTLASIGLKLAVIANV